jgi:hypothetical protein
MNLSNFQIPTMPGAVPGAQESLPVDSMAPPAPAPFPMGAPAPPPMGGPAPQMPGLMSSPMGGIAMPAPQPMDPASMQYDNETQMDGTVLLRVRGPNGEPGPVVQIIKPPGMKGK